MQYMRLADRVDEPEQLSDRRLDLSAFPGTWINAQPDTQGIARLEMTVEGERLSVRVDAVGGDGLIDWGTVEATTIYTAGPASNTGGGFTAHYDFGFMETELQGNLNKGLMVLSIYNRFADGSGRRKYFTREYFAVTHGLFGR